MIAEYLILPNSFYTSYQTFNLEKDVFSKQVWFYVGSKKQLPEDNDYLARNIMGTSFFVQNIKGKYKAFRNLCTHRSSLIRIEKCGNNKIQCPYHGWVFNDDGEPVGIPSNKALFQIDSQQRKKLSLETFDIETCGEFIFIRFFKTGRSLQDYLGGYYTILDKISKSFDYYLDTHQLDSMSNWKLNVENSLDEYHIASIHPSTFGQRGLLQEGHYHYTYASPHSAMFYNASDPSKMGTNYISEQIEEYPFVNDGYAIFYIFPNLNVISTIKSALVMQTFEPQSVDRTIVNNDFFWSGNPKPSYKKITETYLMRVFGEDKIPCEIMQRGKHQTDIPKIIGKQESRILPFQRDYNSFLGS